MEREPDREPPEHRAGTTDARELAELAVELAEGAGALVVRGRRALAGDGTDLAGRLGVTTKSTPTDVVTEMDRRSERFLTEQLRRRRPGDGYLAEEGGERHGTTGVRWLIDPIDGTVNFLYGIPVYAVSVAAERDGVTVAGAVHNPVSGETFHAARGHGAWLDGTRLSGPAATRLDRALVGSGFAYDASVRAEQAGVAARMLPRVRDLRRLGAASIDLCFVAAGRLDAYYERGLSPWDHAAGGLVAEEAGAVLSGLRGRPPGPWFVLAAARPIAAELATLLEEFDADGPAAPR